MSKSFALFILLVILGGSIQYSYGDFDTQGLDATNDVHSVVINEIIYAVVTDYGKNTFEIIDISIPNSPVIVSTIKDGNLDKNGDRFNELDGPLDVDTFVIGGLTYAVIVAFDDNGFQIIDITDPYFPLAVSAVTDDNATDFNILNGGIDVDIVVIGGLTYAIIIAYDESGFQIVDISNPYIPIAVFSAVDGDLDGDGINTFDELYGVNDVDTFVVDGLTYAIITAYRGDGFQIIDISTPSSPLAVSSASVDEPDDNGIFYNNFSGVFGVSTIIIDDSTYAVITAHERDTFKIINISNPYIPFIASSVTDGDTDSNGETFDMLDGTLDVTTTVIGELTYAIISSHYDSGVQFVDITNPSSPLVVLPIADGDFDIPQGASGVAIAVIDDSVYALVTDYNDTMLAIIDLTAAAQNAIGDNSLTKEDKNGGNSYDHHTRPTFGIDHSTFAKIVDNAFTFNENSFDIIHNFWTPFDIQTINIGETNNFSAKVYADKRLKVQEFLFGIPKIGDAHKAELGVEVFYNQVGDIILVNIEQKTDIVDASTLKVTHTKSKCQSDDAKEICDVTYLSMKFLEPLKDNVMAIKAVDYSGRYQITYLNDGFDIFGDSLNPMIQQTISGPEKYEGPITVTQTAKYSNIWVAEDGRLFESNESNTFTWINFSHERQTDTGNINTRLHSEFYRVQQYELDRALEIMAQLCPRCADEPYDKINNIFAYEFPEPLESKLDNPEIQRLLKSEDTRAKQLLDELIN